MNLRAAAANETCTVRLDGCRVEPCVLAHYRHNEWCGMALKPHDLVAAHACSSCHDLLDRRKKLPEGRYMTAEEIDAAFGRAMGRTITRLVSRGLLQLKGDRTPAPRKLKRSKGRTASPRKSLPRPCHE